MTATALRAGAPVAAALALALALTGCAGAARSTATAVPSNPAPTAPALPVPVLKVGDPFAADLMGDGQATVTVVATEVSSVAHRADTGAPKDRVQLVVTVRFVLNKAGKPIEGGPRNFLFRDTAKTLYPARTSGAAFPPELKTVTYATAGQQASGKIVFDVPADQVTGGQVQLVTGRLVHAIWAV